VRVGSASSAATNRSGSQNGVAEGDLVERPHRRCDSD
jgi:hypothetical protein